jgi:putative chitinase
MIEVDAQTMREVAPSFSGANGQRQNSIIAAVGEVLARTLHANAIDNRLRIAHFLAQTCHESAGFRTTEEFASGQAYEGRADLGNVNAGDGVRYKGRGLLQLTGRANYRDFGLRLDIELEDHPEQAAEPVLSLTIACEFWKRKGVNAACDADDVVRVTNIINGGSNGLDDRRALTSKAKTAIARPEGFVLQRHRATEREPAGPAPGLQGRHRRRTAAATAGAGLHDPVDNDFGAGTEVALAAFQTPRGLEPVDGIVGNDTWTALDALGGGT